MSGKIDILKKILFDNDRKSLLRIYRDIKWIKNSSPFKDKSINHYFECLMYKKDAGKIEDYLPRAVYGAFIHTPHYKHRGNHPVLGNKRVFKELSIKNNLATSKYLGSINNYILSSVNPKVELNLKEEEKVKGIIIKWIEQEGSVFIKRVNGQEGTGVYKVDSWESFLEIPFEKREYLIEGEIKQIKDLDKVNPNCVTTLRLATVLKNGEPFIMGSYYRTGAGNAYLDHTTLGGVMVPYDIFQNKLARVGYSTWKFSGKSHAKHPNTGFTFKDKPLPYPEKVIELAKQAAVLVPDKVLVGWDIAYTDEGPIIIEGNDNPALGGLQIAFRGLLSNKYFKEIYEEYFNSDGTLKANISNQ